MHVLGVCVRSISDEVFKTIVTLEKEVSSPRQPWIEKLKLHFIPVFLDSSIELATVGSLEMLKNR